MRALGERQSWDLTKGLPNNRLKLTNGPGWGGHGAAARHHAHGFGARSQLNLVLGGPVWSHRGDEQY